MAARVAVRFDEVFESLRLVGVIVDAMPDGEVDVGWPSCRRSGSASATSKAGAARCSWRWRADGRQHSPLPSARPVVVELALVLEHAVIGNIVPDFPLINKSFNLSYSGHDL